MGYALAGFDVVGVDVEPQPSYPFRFWQLDALTLEPWVIAGFDAVHASPPCQAWALSRDRQRTDYPELVGPTRALLDAGGRPYVIENVPQAPLREPVTLCGGGAALPVVRCDDGKLRQVRRHRAFETNWPLLVPSCWHPFPALGVYGHGQWSNDDSDRRGGYQGSKRECAEAMGIDWMPLSRLTQAIPPAFTELIGHQLAAYLDHAATGTAPLAVEPIEAARPAI